MKNKNLIIGLVIAVVVLVGGGVFVLSSNNKAQEPIEQVPVENEIASISPEEVGLDLIPTNNNKHVLVKVEKPEGIKTIEYELTWGVKIKDISSGELLDGQQGTTSVNEPIHLNGKAYVNEIKFGTCSDVCHYDQGVNNVKIILKVVKTDGKVYQSEKILEGII